MKSNCCRCFAKVLQGRYWCLNSKFNDVVMVRMVWACRVLEFSCAMQRFKVLSRKVQKGQSEKCKVAKYSIAKSQSARHRSQRDTSYKYSCCKEYCHSLAMSDVVVEFLCSRGQRISCKVTPVENTRKRVEAGIFKNFM